MEAFATPYPVFFNDGEKDLDKGVIGIHSCLNFKRFQSMAGQKAGLPPATLSTVFVCRKSSGNTEKKQKLPINEHTNFSIILNQHNPSREKDCFFLVSLKKSKKERRAAKKKVAEPEFVDAEGSVAASSTPSSPKSVDDVSLFKDKSDSSSSDEESSESRVSEFQERQERIATSEKFPAKNASRPPVEPSHPPVSAWKAGSALKILKNQEALKSTAIQGDASGCRGAVSDMAIGAVSTPAETHASVVASKSHAASPSSHVPVLKHPVDHQIRSSFEDQSTQACQARSSHSVARVVPTSDNFAASSLASATSAASAMVEGHFAQPSHAVPGSGFSLFGPDLSSVALGSMFHNVMPMDLRFGTRKWCKFCAFCQDRHIMSVPFHWCVDDQVVTGFKGPSRAGPIGTRPMMKHRVGAMG